ncbi:MAG: zf-HC2 domain-containing protein [Desulfobacterales bacterium]|nr:zf-HC2 domain-containing protein [Desulfobacterales bacterium]
MKSSCMDIEQLDAYIRQRLPDEERDRMEEHLSRCDACLEEFVIGTTLLRDVKLSEWDQASEEEARSLLNGLHLPEKLKTFYAWTKRVIPDLVLQPDPAFVRNGENAPARTEYILLNKDFNDLHAEMCLEKIRNSQFSIRTKVLKNTQTVKNVRLTLLREGGAVSSRPLKGLHERFKNLPYGQYRLILAQDAVDKGEYCFKIDDGGLDEK